MTEANTSRPSVDPETLELIQEFVAESKEVVTESEPALVQLERPDNDPEIIASSVSAVFRLFHSMKGTAGLLGLDHVARITHSAESLLAMIRDSESIPEPEDVDALCQALDCINILLAEIERSYSDHGHDALVNAAHDRLVLAIEAFEARHSPAKVNKEKVFNQEQLEQLHFLRTAAIEDLERFEGFLVESETTSIDHDKLQCAMALLHTIKGNAGFLSLRPVELLCHAMENVLSSLHATQATHFRAATTSVLFKSLDRLRAAIHAAETGANVPDLDVLVQSLGQQIQPEHSNWTATEEVPTVKQLGEILLDQGALSEDDLDLALAWQNKRLGEIVVDLHLVDQSSVDEALVEQQKSKIASEDSPIPAIKPAGSHHKSACASTIRVDLLKLDALLNQVGELITAAETVVQRPELRQEGAEQLLHYVWHLSRITGGLHDTAMSMRMIPVRPTFRKVLRVVRDLSKKIGKDIDVILEGENTEIDKTVVEAIADPLMHIIRNAVDHGIEKPADREAAGKPRQGKITLSSHHEGGEVFICVQDDGKGIDPQKVIAKAKERGIVDPKVENLPRQEAYELLFSPGFSTAEKITDISGRGVGMDVVRRNIESIRGRIQISSEVGKGTTFTIRIPLTLAIIDGMLVRVGSNLYSVPLLAIRESVRVSENQRISLPEGGEMVKIRDEVYPVFRLHEFHDVPNAEKEMSKGILILIENDNQTICLFADEIVGQRQMVVKALDPFVANIRGVSGCSITGTGEICLILDVHSLIVQQGTSSKTCNPPPAETAVA